MTRRVLSLVLAIAMVAAACTKSSDDRGSAAQSPAGSLPFTAAELTYGVAPTPAEGVEYQDDVVIVGGGAESIRAMSPDGLSWTIAGNASGLDDLDVGSVMFVTGRAVGRVLAIEPVDGGDRKVTIGPVEITEVYRELDVEFDQPVELASMPMLTAPSVPDAFSEIKLLPDEPDATSPDGPGSTGGTDGTGESPSTTEAPGSDSEPAPDDSGSAPDTTEGAAPAASDGSGQWDTEWADAIELPPVQLIANPTAPVAAFPTPRPAGVHRAIDLNGFNVTPYANQGVGVGLKYDRGGVRVDVLMAVRLSSPTLKFNLVITDGKIQRATVDLKGAAGLTLHLKSASAVGLDNNVNGNLVLPIDISIPVSGIGVPFAITFSQRVLVKTAFSAKNSTLEATGDYSLSGGFSMGYQNGGMSVSGPVGFSVRQSLVHSIDGMSVGVNGIVLAHAVRVVVGIGAFGFATGPYFDFITSFGITNGSDLGIVKCKGGSLDMFLGAGIGYQIPQAVSRGINAILRALNLKQIQPAGGLELARTNILHKESITPKAKICREGAA